jgi:hypothetical protein
VLFVILKIRSFDLSNNLELVIVTRRTRRSKFTIRARSSLALASNQWQYAILNIIEMYVVSCFYSRELTHSTLDYYCAIVVEWLSSRL